MTENRLKNELILPDGNYAFTQDTTSGIIKTHTGPLVVNMTGQDNPVKFNPNSKIFERVALESAAQTSPLVPQGYYCVLWNPTPDLKHPAERDKSPSPSLLMGQRVNIPGPCTFALWPRQSANVIEGHHLRSNQYLIVRVYDEEAAQANWATSIMKPAEGVEGSKDVAIEPTDLIVGKQLIIRGTEVSFYIPPTGLEVVQDTDGSYAREAVTLERLAYCILVDEDGNKRYERGPQVIFPKPTEHFFEMASKKGTMKIFTPIELNAIQGIHIKVIAPYKEDGREYKEGEELFITGKDMPIYFPRPEHSIIKYDGRAKNYATAVPVGEARYVMARETGEIERVKGPMMLLPDPRSQVIIRRVLSERQCELWYPGNQEVLQYNRDLLTLSSAAPTTRSGVVSEGQVRRSKKMKNFHAGSSDMSLTAAEASTVSSMASAVMGDEFSRGSTYTQPRTVTLNSKFAGVPTVNIWTGYAVMVVSKSGARRVEVGPQTVLLDYDESLEVIEMSTGKPKTTDRKLHSVYLRVSNNKVSDIIEAETKDHVKIRTKLSLRVSFTGSDHVKWFEVENYIKFLTDHVRSLLKSNIRKLTISEFYSRSEEVIRDTILGAKASPKKGGKSSRTGLFFEENNMKVVDVDVLNVDINHPQIASKLEATQHEVVQGNIQLEAAERHLEREQRLEEIARQRAQYSSETAATKAQLEHERIQRDLEISLKRLGSQIEESAKVLERQTAKEAVTNAATDANLERKDREAALNASIKEALQVQKIALLSAETLATVSRLKAVEAGFSESLMALGNQETLIKVAEAMSVQTMLGGKDLTEVIGKVFEGSPLGAVVKGVMTKAAGNGVGRMKSIADKTQGV